MSRPRSFRPKFSKRWSQNSSFCRNWRGRADGPAEHTRPDQSDSLQEFILQQSNFAVLPAGAQCTKREDDRWFSARSRTPSAMAWSGRMAQGGRASRDVLAPVPQDREHVRELTAWRRNATCCGRCVHISSAICIATASPSAVQPVIVAQGAGRLHPGVREGPCFDPGLNSTDSTLQRVVQKNDVSAYDSASIFRCTAYPFGIDHAYVKISNSRYLLRGYVECFIGALRMNGGAVH